MTYNQQQIDDLNSGRVVLTLEILPDDTPGRIRLRHFLKRALRDWKLRCKRIVREGADPPAQGTEVDLAE